jgi:hypothetical protein
MVAWAKLFIDSKEPTAKADATRQWVKMFMLFLHTM